VKRVKEKFVQNFLTEFVRRTEKLAAEVQIFEKMNGSVDCIQFVHDRTLLAIRH